GLEAARGKNPDQQWNAEDTRQRDGIRQIQRDTQHPPGGTAKNEQCELSSTRNSESNGRKSVMYRKAEFHSDQLPVLSFLVRLLCNPPSSSSVMNLPFSLSP